MPDFQKMEKALRETLLALGQDALDRLILIGGWLPYIYSTFHWKLPTSDFPQTTDIDLGVPETGAAAFKETVFRRLKRAGLALERVYSREAFPIQFLYRSGRTAVKVEFITDEYTSDDTRNRFLGRELAWNRIDGMGVVLTSPMPLTITLKGTAFRINVPTPETFFFHKGIVFALRSNEAKRWKDAYALFWGLRFAPSQDQLVKGILGFSDQEAFALFKETLLENFSGPEKIGYQKLRPLLIPWMPPDQVTGAIRETFSGLLSKLKH